MKSKDVKKLDSKERQKKVEELRLELVKARVTASKGGKAKINEIKKTLARLLTINHAQKK